ncbi:MAG: hypothetical protein ACK55Z_10125, partial [bacterium]
VNDRDRYSFQANKNAINLQKRSKCTTSRKHIRCKTFRQILRQQFRREINSNKRISVQQHNKPWQSWTWWRRRLSDN